MLNKKKRDTKKNYKKYRKNKNHYCMQIFHIKHDSYLLLRVPGNVSLVCSF